MSKDSSLGTFNQLFPCLKQNNVRSLARFDIKYNNKQATKYSTIKINMRAVLGLSSIYKAQESWSSEIHF